MFKREIKVGVDYDNAWSTKKEIVFINGFGTWCKGERAPMTKAQKIRAFRSYLKHLRTRIIDDLVDRDKVVKAATVKLAQMLLDR